MNKIQDTGLELFKEFGHVYVINRACDKDRRDHITRELQGVDFELFEATDGWENQHLFKKDETNQVWDGWTPGAAGLVDTKIRILKDAIEKGYENILVMEDDIVFNYMFNKQSKLCWDMKPENWELFHFAAKDYARPQRMGKIKRLKSAWSCQIYAINSSIYQEYIDQLVDFDKPIDLVTSKYFHPRGNSYATKYNMIDTLPNMSAIRNKFVHY